MTFEKSRIVHAMATNRIGCNTINANDTINFILFLEELRAHPTCNNYTLSAAVSLAPFNDAEGNPSTDLSRLGNALDHIVIMNYDVWGPWSDRVGPNMPLFDSCAPPPYQQGSGEWAVEQWTKAGIPLEKIVLGVGAYGRGFTVAELLSMDLQSNWPHILPSTKLIVRTVTNGTIPLETTLVVISIRLEEPLHLGV